MRVIVDELNHGCRKVSIPCEDTSLEARSRATVKGVNDLLYESDELLITILCTEDQYLLDLIKGSKTRFLMPSNFSMEEVSYNELFSGANVLIDPSIHFLKEIKWYYQTALSFDSRVMIFCRYDPYTTKVPMQCMEKGLIIRASTKYYED